MDLLRTPWSGTAVVVPVPVAPALRGLPSPSGALVPGAAAELLACPWTGTDVHVPAPPALTGLPVLAPSLPVQRAAAEPVAAPVG